MASVKYGAAAKRHFDDAELLFKNGAKHLAGADHLYGLVVECALKRNLQKCRLLTLANDGKPEQEGLKGTAGHCPGLWKEYILYMGVDRGLPPIGPNLFSDWTISDRYTDGRHLQLASIEKHREAASDILISSSGF